ncbi:MAG TPA: hypothetical protein VHC90_25240 [Bryobacteraceae bacterium]|nr:hypothetical protein [Bryobacteraceae bacterium]
MAKRQVEGGRSRREIIQLASGAGLGLVAQQYSFAASDFWIKKKPAEWTDQEKDELRTKSPWAKKVDAESSGGGGRSGGGGGLDTGGMGSAEGSSAPRGGGGGRGRGGGGGGGADGGGGGGGGAATIALSIVWESAKPIQDAHPLALPPKLDNHYVIAVTGIPPQMLNRILMGGGRGRGRGPNAEGGDAAAPAAAPGDQTAPLKAGVTISVKGKDALNPDAVMSMNSNSTLLFAFPKDALPITAADKEVEFVIRLTGLSAKAKFNLKDMMYNEQLAI